MPSEPRERIRLADLGNKIDRTALPSIDAEGAKISKKERYEKNCEIISNAFGIVLDNDDFVKQAIEKKAFIDSKTVGTAKEKVERAINNIAKAVESEFNKRDLYSLDLDETKLPVEMAEIIANTISMVRDTTKTFKNFVLSRCGEIIEAKKAEIEAAKNKILPAEVLKKPDDAKKEIGETEKRVAISKFLWGNLKSAIEERFGDKVYFKRFITDEVVNRFIKELGDLFYVNEEGFIKPKNTSENGLRDFRMKVGKFTKNFLKDIDESIKAKKGNEKAKDETEKTAPEKSKPDEKSKFKVSKLEFIGEFGLVNFNKKYKDGEGSSFDYSDYSAETGLVTIRVWYAGVDYSEEKRQDKMKIDLEKFRELMDEMKKPNGGEGKKTIKEMLGFREKKVEKLEVGGVEQEFTEKETRTIKIFENSAADFVKRLKEESNWDGYSDEDKENTIRIQTGVFLTRQFRKRNLFSVNEKEVVEQIFNKIKK